VEPLEEKQADKEENSMKAFEQEGTPSLEVQALTLC
jgi:hypothetical protein